MGIVSCSAWNYRESPESAGLEGKGWENDGEKPSGGHSGDWRSKLGDPLLPTGTRLGLDRDFGFGEIVGCGQNGKFGSFPGSDISKRAEGPHV